MNGGEERGSLRGGVGSALRRAQEASAAAAAGSVVDLLARVLAGCCGCSEGDLATCTRRVRARDIFSVFFDLNLS